MIASVEAPERLDEAEAPECEGRREAAAGGRGGDRAEGESDKPRLVSKLTVSTVSLPAALLTD